MNEELNVKENIEAEYEWKSEDGNVNVYLYTRPDYARGVIDVYIEISIRADKNGNIIPKYRSEQMLLGEVLVDSWGRSDNGYRYKQERSSFKSVEEVIEYIDSIFEVIDRIPSQQTLLDIKLNEIDRRIKERKYKHFRLSM